MVNPNMGSSEDLDTISVHDSLFTVMDYKTVDDDIRCESRRNTLPSVEFDVVSSSVDRLERFQKNVSFQSELHVSGEDYPQWFLRHRSVS